MDISRIAGWLILLSAAPPAAAEPLDLRILSFNIRYGAAEDGPNHWVKRRDLVFGVLRDRRPDVAGLQEVMRFQEEEILSALPEYGAISSANREDERRAERVTILYRKERFAVGDSGTFWFSDTPDVMGSTGWGNTLPRICSWARLVDRPSGRAFWFYNLHIDHLSQPSRERSARYLARRLRERPTLDPVIVTGDFNAGEDNPAILWMKGMPADGGAGGVLPPPLVDTFRVLHPGAKDAGTFHGFTGLTNRPKIDFIFAPPWARVLEAEILRDRPDGRWPSDHFPVHARLVLPPAREL
jgi:endonuclease/exonuclease/phosphatase family metal-dependent hydrolase